MKSVPAAEGSSPPSWEFPSNLTKFDILDKEIRIAHLSRHAATCTETSV